MRTAEEIYHSIVNYEWNDVSEHLKKTILEAINEARRECIDECAEAAKIEWQARPFLTQRPVVDKQSILKLKDQIK